MTQADISFVDGLDENRLIKTVCDTKPEGEQIQQNLEEQRANPETNVSDK